MIVETILDWIQTALLWLVGLFPDSDVDPFGYLDDILGHLGDLNYFLPIAETVTIVVAVMALFPVFLGVSLSLWVVAQLRGSSSVG